MLRSITIPLSLTPSQKRTMTVVGLVLLLLAASTSAFAQDTGFKLLDGVDAAFAGKANKWDGVIRVYANRLFWLLATADFCFLCATFVLDKKELDDMLASVIRKLMTLGFFWFVLQSSNDWIPRILNSFTQIGQQAGQAGGNYVTPSTPDGVAGVGFQAAMAAFQALSDLGTMEKLGAVYPTILMAIIMFLSFLWVAAQLLICKIETSIAVGAGIILLGFGGSKWTTDMASKYMQYSVATGLKLMLMYLLIGMGMNLFVDTHIVGGDQFFQSLFITTGTALTFGFLATKIPAIASAMMSGSPSLTAGDMTGAVIGAGAAVAGMAAAGMAAGKAGLGAATSGAAAATGVGQALQAGIASGMDLGKSGAGLAAHALGEVASHGMGLASAGVGDMLAGGASSFQGRVGESVGGRVATSINAARGGSMAGVAAPAGGSDAGGSGAAPGGGASSSSAGQSASSAASGSPSNAPSSSGAAPSSADGAGPGASGDAASSAAEAANAATGSGDASMPMQSAGASQAASSATGGAAQAAVAGGSDAGVSGGGKPAATPTTGATNQMPGAATAPAPSSATGAGAQSGQRASQAASSSNGSPSTAQPSALAGNGSTPTGAAPSGTGTEQSKGDASSGAVSGGKGEGSGNNGQNDRKPTPMHERIRELQGYVPDDAAHSATFHIDLKHTE